MAHRLSRRCLTTLRAIRRTTTALDLTREGGGATPAASSCPAHGSRKRRVLTVGLLTAGMTMTIGYWTYKTTHSGNRDIHWPLPVANCDSANTKRSQQFNFVAEAVEKVSPCVVLIQQERKTVFFFGGAHSAPSSGGSGFIIDDGNYVLTNAHVVGTSHSVTVQLYDGRKIKGFVTDIDQVADLALVKLELGSKERLPALQFGSSSELRPGEWVIALGSPLSLSNTITSGIVSSVHRPVSEIPDPQLHFQKPDMEYIQTDAAITFGNSGGPLVNLDGEVIGINTMTAGPGISFAVPSDFAKKFLKTAKRTTTRDSSFSEKYGIGISMLTITPNLQPHIQSRTSFTISGGVLLAEVWRGSPADLAGLKRHDIIVKMNSRKVTESKQIFKEVQTGKPIEFEVLRGNEKRLIVVKPERL